MKTRNPSLILALAITLAAASLTGTTRADEASFRAALKSIPAKYLADITLAKRDTFLRELATDTTTHRLDAKNGWLHWFTDGGSAGGTSMIWAKELPRTGKAPLLFVHMAKPFSGRMTGKPATDQTFVLEPVGDEWVDITRTVIPSTIDLTLHFRTRKEDTTIEVAVWKDIAPPGSGRQAYDFGERTHDLRWIGNGFVVEKPAAKKLTDN